MSGTLFEMPDTSPETPKPDGKKAPPRLERADRAQVTLHPSDLESLLPQDHRARVVWDFVTGLDLSAFHDRIKSREGGPGRGAVDPAIVLSLWIYATIEGVGSARAVSRLTEEHDAYRWICGGVTVHHDTLSSFRGERPQEIDALLTQIVATLTAEGLARLDRVAQDGLKVRAYAGAASFRRKPKLERCMEEAEQLVEKLRKEIDDDPAATMRRRKERDLREAKSRAKRVKRALKELKHVEAKKKPADREKARASTTDPEARVMKTGDGGFRPAFNCQFSTDTVSQTITGVDVVQAGSDWGQMPPMLDQIEERTGRRPAEILVDGGYAQHDSIDAAAAKDVVVYAPVHPPRKGSLRDPHEPRSEDSAAVAAWRARMATPEAKEIYKQRAATAECVNAIARNRGLRQFLVRGIRKVKTVLTIFAIAHDLMRAAALRAAVAPHPPCA
jgi:transposase